MTGRMFWQEDVDRIMNRNYHALDIDWAKIRKSHYVGDLPRQREEKQETDGMTLGDCFTTCSWKSVSSDSKCQCVLGDLFINFFLLYRKEWSDSLLTDYVCSRCRCNNNKSDSIDRNSLPAQWVKQRLVLVHDITVWFAGIDEKEPFCP